MDMKRKRYKKSEIRWLIKEINRYRKRGITAAKACEQARALFAQLTGRKEITSRQMEYVYCRYHENSPKGAKYVRNGKKKHKVKRKAAKKGGHGGLRIPEGTQFLVVHGSRVSMFQKLSKAEAKATELEQKGKPYRAFKAMKPSIEKEIIVCLD